MRQKTKIRLYTEQLLACDNKLCLNEAQSHYLTNVMKHRLGDNILCFDNQNGEFLCQIIEQEKKQITLSVLQKTRNFYLPPDLWLLFAPIKKDNTDFIIQKATELGVRKIIPVITKNTITNKVKRDRFIAQSIEAAEQSRRVDLPEISESISLEKLLQNWDESRRLFFLNETLTGHNITDSFAKFQGKAAILCGPEGGFDEKEILALQNQPFVVSLSLGPRILRAETAAIAAVSCFQAVCGDWRTEK
mgnify:CR=1 FL=1